MCIHVHVCIPVYRSWIIWLLILVIFRQRVRSLNTKRNTRKRKRVTKRRSIQYLTVHPMQTVKVTATHPCLTRNCYNGRYWKPTFNHVQEIFARFARAMYSKIFLAMNQSLPQAYLNITGINKAWLQKLVVANYR